MRRRFRKVNPPPPLMLSPMIDMIFLLLVFFIVSTMYMSELRSIPIRLPSAKNSETLKKSKHKKRCFFVFRRDSDRAATIDS